MGVKDRKTVMSWLEGLTQDDWEVWYSDSEVQETAKAALELLKEQEAVEPILKREGRNKYYNYYVCRCCDNDLFYQQNYCSECGRAVKWE